MLFYLYITYDAETPIPNNLVTLAEHLLKKEVNVHSELFKLFCFFFKSFYSCLIPLDRDFLLIVKKMFCYLLLHYTLSSRPQLSTIVIIELPYKQQKFFFCCLFPSIKPNKT